jgi:hypothetical protein
MLVPLQWLREGTWAVHHGILGMKQRSATLEKFFQITLHKENVGMIRAVVLTAQNKSFMHCNFDPHSGGI